MMFKCCCSKICWYTLCSCMLSMMSFFPLASIQSTQKLELLLSCIHYQNSQDLKYVTQPPHSLLPAPQKIWVWSDYLSNNQKKLLAQSPFEPGPSASKYPSLLRLSECNFWRATGPLHLWARSQFLPTWTPPFLAFGLYWLRSQFLLNILFWPSALTNLSWPSALTHLSRPSALTHLSRPSALTYLFRPSASTDFGFAEMRLRRFTILENSCNF